MLKKHWFSHYFLKGQGGPEESNRTNNSPRTVSFLAYGGTLETYLRQFDVEKHEMASVMGMCAGLVGLKSVNVKKALVFSLLFEGSRRPGGIQDNEQVSEPGRLGGGRGRVNPPPGACLEVLGGLEGLLLGDGLYTPGGQRLPRIYISPNGFEGRLRG